MTVVLAFSALVAVASCIPIDPPKSGEVHGTLIPTHTGRALVATVTAYSATGNLTRSGTVPAFGTVAVDPAVIPLGSRLLIDGFPGVVFTALDTGGGVRGAWVDVYLPSHAEAIRFGRQTRTITILN